MSLQTENSSAFRAAFTTSCSTNPKGMTYTENGALAHDSTGKNTLDFYTRVMARDKATAMPDADIETCLSASYNEDPSLTLRLLAQLRDIRGQGKGERHATKICWLWMLKNHPEQLYANMTHLPFFGRWKDLLDFCGTDAELPALKLFAAQLQMDLAAVNSKESDTPPEEAFVVVEAPDKEESAVPSRVHVSLAAKWAPSEKCHEDKIAVKAGRTPPSYTLANLLADADPSAPRGITNVMRWYRKTYLTPLRSVIDIVEKHLCSKQYDSVEFSKVPGVALKIYSKKTFPTHMADRFAQWQTDVLAGKAKINSGTVDPYEVVSQYLNMTVTEAQKPTLEAFYRDQLDKLRTSLSEKYGYDHMEDSVVVVDVSGSMGSRGSSNNAPLCASIAMGVWISALARKDWRDLVFTFSTTPSVVDLKHCKTLEDRVSAVANCNGHGTSTNIQALFDLILTRAKERALTQDQMPARLIIVSDMQFNDACGHGSAFTNLEVARAKFRSAGYSPPIVVFWNVRGNTGNTGSPAVHDDRGVIMLSGYSKSMIPSLLDGSDMPTPYDMMLKVLSDPRYDCMTLVN
jgi:hypothetical protein